MTGSTLATIEPPPAPPAPRGSTSEPLAWLPSWQLVATRLLELRKRTGLMITVVVLICAPTVLLLGFRLAFHAFDPKSYGPAGSPSIFSALSNVMASFGFIAAAVLGTAAGSTDLSDGVFRHLVVTGRSRLALYFARLPAGLLVLVPLVAAAFLSVCLVTSFEGTPTPSTVSLNGYSVPWNLDQQQLESWILAHPSEALQAIVAPKGVGPVGLSQFEAGVPAHIAAYYGAYEQAALSSSPPADNEMAKVGLWVELNVLVGFVVGLGLGSLMGQRTVSTILMVALQIIITPIVAATTIPYFINGQRLVVGLALDQLRPAALAGQMGSGGGHGPGHVLFGSRAALSIPAMPTWAMVSVIVGWLVVWTALGAWRMATRDA